MKTVLVTGAYGFLGRYVVKEMKEHGYHVRAFGRDAGKLAALADENTEIFQGDFCDPDSIRRAAQGMDVVIHCGALLKGWGRREDFMRTNVLGTQNVIDACAAAGVKRLVYVSSPSAYAMRDNRNITEADYNTHNRLSFYIESKILAERLVRKQKKVPYSIIRPRGLCGIGDRNMLPVLINTNRTIGIPLFEKSRVAVDLCCAENAALSLRLCAEKDAALGQVYNITNGEPRLLKELAEELFEALGTKARFIRLPFLPMYGIASVLEAAYRLLRIYDRAPAVTRYNICTLGRTQIFDITKAREELGYEPVIALDEMIGMYAEAFREGRA